MKPDLYLCILFLVCSEATLFEHEKFKACRVSRVDCGESSLTSITLTHLQHFYGNCKIILGNLVICDLKRLANGSDPDLSFFESIEEVSGYVYLSRNEVKNIPLKSLKIIRAEPPYDFGGVRGALIVTRNFGSNGNSLETIDFRNLIAIQRHNVVVKDNPHLCNFAFTVYWEGVFVNPQVQRYIPDRTNSSLSQRSCNITVDGKTTQTYKSCDGTCPMANRIGYCWGPGPEMCQKMVKCQNNPTHYCVDGPVGDQFCDEECLGGCVGSSSNCRACKHVENNGKCVSQCPPEFIVSRKDSRTIPNPDFKYNYYDTCVEDCPAPFLKSKAYCVIECDLSSEIPVNGTCQACPPTGCPEHCTQKSIFGSQELSIVDSDALRKFKNCVYYTGMLYISEESFKESRTFTKPIRDLSLLWNLRNLRSIVGHVYMDLRGAPPDLTNLTFLGSLRSLVLEAQDSGSGTVLQIMNGVNVELLGFRSLTYVDGAVYLHNMPKLCYLVALSKMTQFRSVNVSSEERCIQRNAICHSECLPQLGCWGPGADMCRHCCNLQAGDYCVSECTDRSGFYEIPGALSSSTRHLQSTYPTNQPFCLTLPLNGSQMQHLNNALVRASKIPARQCSRCHAECAETCYGPGSHECIGGCRNFKDGDDCVPQCPRTKFSEPYTDQCLPCNAVCNPKHIPPDVTLCSGPGDHFGLGGCTACWTVMQNTTTKHFTCLTDDCPEKYYKESHKMLEFVKKEQISISKASEDLSIGMINLCKPCHPFCSVCTANGTHMSICHSCLHWWFRVECVEECPPAETYNAIVNGNSHNETVQSVNNPISVEGRDRLSRSVTVISTVENASGKFGMMAHGPLFLSRNTAGQRQCLLCHEECVQGCSGPGPDHCFKCRNYKVLIDSEEKRFTCKSSCPEDQPHVFHSMCLTAEQYAKLSGRSARELRDRILIGVAVVVIVLITLVTVGLIVCLKRRAEAERIREKLFSAYTNLNVPDKEAVMKNQTGIREPNMGRLEMISADELDFDQTDSPLGTGAFGVVYRGIWRLSKAALLKHGCHGAQRFDVAIKVIQNDCPITPGVLKSSSPTANGGARDPEEEAWRAAARANVEELLQEAKVMASVEHKHCLPLIGVSLTRERHCLVTMFLELGSLDRYVKEHREELNSLDLLSWAEQIADGMSYLEDRGIIHRDLAARNVLVQRRDLVQITDFGLAKMLERRDEDSVVVRAGRVPIRWLAIETLQDSIYSHKTDVWAYGVTLWEIFTYGRRPYEDVETKDIKDHVVKGGRLTQPEICTLDVYMVMVKCWIEDYESRPTFSELTRTFANFCKTPGRYLYIQGDEFAIHYHTSNYHGSSTSADTHELRPLLSHRGTPDGSANIRINGSLTRSLTNDLTSNAPSYAQRYPSHFGAKLDAEYNQPIDDSLHQPFSSVDEPDESESLLPVRNSGGHSMWPLRSRGQGVGATSPIAESEFLSAQGGATAASKVPIQAPLAMRENSWLADAPCSPSWRSAKSPQNLTSRQLSHGSDTRQQKILPPTASSPFGPSRSFVHPGSDEFGPLPHSPAAKSKISNDLDYLSSPPTAPRTPIEGYLEPKPGLSSTVDRKFQPTGVTIDSLRPQESSVPQSGLEYLVPKNTKPPLDPHPNHNFGISNMEYFMQPYISPDSATNHTETSSKQKGDSSSH